MLCFPFVKIWPPTSHHPKDILKLNIDYNVNVCPYYDNIIRCFVLCLLVFIVPCSSKLRVLVSFVLFQKKAP